MNSIAKYFDKNSKKRELSDESKTSEEPKKHREDNEISYIENPDVFSEGMESEHCKNILYKCLKNLEKLTKFTILQEVHNNYKLKAKDTFQKYKKQLIFYLQNLMN